MAIRRPETRRRTGISLLILTLAWLFGLLVVYPALKAVRRLAAPAGRQVRYWAGRPRAFRARRARRAAGPSPAEFPDAAVAEAVCSALLALERRWDIRRINVEVEDRVVILHGEVPSGRAARTVERFALRVPGVEGLESYLHVGPIHEGARPSAGMRYPEPSEAKRRLLQAAYKAGAPVDITQQVVRAVLGFLADWLPPAELEQLTSHLPRDTRALCHAPIRNGAQRKPVRTVAELVANLAPATGPLTPPEARRVIEAVLGTLRELVPEEDADIAAVLPDDLRTFWRASIPV